MTDWNFSYRLNIYEVDVSRAREECVCVIYLSFQMTWNSGEKCHVVIILQMYAENKQCNISLVLSCKLLP